MEALDHVPMKAAAVRVLCSSYLGEPVSPHPWVSRGYGMALMLRVGACLYAHTGSFGAPGSRGV